MHPNLPERLGMQRSTPREITARIRQLRKQFRYDLQALLDESARSHADDGVFDQRVAALHRQFDKQVAEILEANNPDEVYHVTRRFDLVHILGITAAFAILFAVLRALGMPPLALLFISGLVVMAGVAQAIFPHSPRVASMAAGFASWVPLMLLTTHQWGSGVLCMAVVFGPLAGYLAGLLAAGVFLVVDGTRRFVRESRTRGYVQETKEEELA